MKKTCCFLTFLTFLIGALSAKTKPVEQDSLQAYEGSAFCSKGVPGMFGGKVISVDFKIIPRYNLQARSSDPTIGNSVGNLDYSRRIKVKFKLPLLNKPSIKMAMGFKYSNETLEFQNDDQLEYPLFQGLNENALKSFGTELYFFKAFNQKYYLISRTAVSFNGDYNKFISLNRKYLTYSILAAFGVKLNDRVELGAGMIYKNSFGFHSYYPVFMYNHSFNDRWGIETLLPYRLRLRYKFSDATYVYAGIEGDAGNYYLNEGALGGSASDKALRMKYTEAKFGVKLQQAIYHPLWFGIEAGYSKNLGMNFRDVDEPKNSPIVESETFGGGWYVNASLFLTVPKKLLNRK